MKRQIEQRVSRRPVLLHVSKRCPNLLHPYPVELAGRGKHQNFRKVEEREQALLPVRNPDERL